MTAQLTDCAHLHTAFGPGCPHCIGPVSPCCGKAMYGGPVVFACTGCGRDVHGSVIDREVPLYMDAKRMTTCGCGSMRSGGTCGCGGAR